ncbi:penicillin-binding protein 1C [Chromobacterium subtsugae]|uniref:penicillin-binding protein 1C n=1 Tax=Chromobacterium subtsugae TaxID=251747 RepID=UPI000A4336BC|nr:penicillin-binding protein 1C [Chromobacterium subtsugae]WSE89724.1 penicillin-binding protein 1C [Chromobacterium subtsugae]WVH58095.1 penicillin-binding protein 1C [Chromobacterium subtsugae]
MPLNDSSHHIAPARKLAPAPSARRWPKLSLVLLALLSAPVCAQPTFKEVKAAWQPSDVTLLDRHGQVLQRLRVDKQARRQDWVGLADTSPAFRQALVLSEDKRFYQHSGVDWSGAAAAAWANLWNTRTRGASTLTMQLAGLLDDDLKAGKGGRNLWQKMGQTWSAAWLERHWSKAEILEAYLNLVGFRGELVGLSSLSSTLFGKLPAGLNLEESAIAVALIRAPNAAPDKVAGRACRILQDMGRKPDCGVVAVHTAQALAKSRAANPLAEQDAPHFAQKLLQRQKLAAGSRVATTLDLPLQRYASAALRRHLAALSQRNVQDGALVVLDNQSGDILAWVGSSGRGLSNAAQVDGVTSLRQAGSSLKPFLYQMALQQRYLTAASLLDDSPLNLQTGAGLYAPQNYSKDFKGLVPVRTALASSLNIPAVRTIEMVTPNAFRDRLVQLGFASLTEDGDYYGYSLALGAADIRLLDLANAYRTLANQGLASPPRWTLADAKAKPTRLLDAASSFIIADILSDRTARALTFGLESALSTRYWSAVKTGTSKDMRDNWAVGFSRRYTVAAWVGNAGGEPMWDVSGMHGAAPMWQTVLDRAQQSAPPSQPPAPPPGLARQRVRYQGDVAAPRTEWFLAGTQRALIVPQKGSAADLTPGIAAPVDGSIFALDPDIPPANQRMVLRARGVAKPQWWLDGKKLGNGVELAWFPWPGRHRLELRAGDGKSVEKVKFEVRGAAAKPKPR